MKRKILLISFLTIGVCLCINTIVKSNSSGAPADVTGAPQDNYTTCAASGCHSDFKLNDTSKGKSIAVQLLDTINAVTSYTPGQKYKLVVTLKKPSCSKMGFEATAFKGTKSTHAGTFSVGNYNDVQLNFFDNNYATHTFGGSVDNMAGIGKFYVYWTAPAKGTGTVNIYTAGNLADGNGGVSGDYIMTNKLAISESATGIDEAREQIQDLHIFPNPMHEQINLTYSLKEAGNVGMEITDMNGKQLQRLYYGIQTVGEHTFNAKLDELPAGIYFLRLSIGNSSLYEKIMIR